MTAIARALWLDPPAGASLREEALPARAARELVVRTRYTAISRGTETLVYRGEVPPAEYRRMRAPFQAGEFPGPVKHGYANVGIVEDGPAEWVGRTIFCLFPHQTRYVVPEGAVVPLPDGVPAARAVLAANMETAVNALWDGAPRVGDRITIVGAGVLGCLVAALCTRLPGVEVELVDTEPSRAAVARTFGARYARPEDAQDNRDLVFHASATSAGLNTALGAIGAEGEVIELSWYGTRRVDLGLGGRFHSQRLTLRASQVGTVAPARAARWSHRRRLELAVRLCADERLDVLFAQDERFDALPQVMRRLVDVRDHTLCQRIVYPSPD